MKVGGTLTQAEVDACITIQRERNEAVEELKNLRHAVHELLAVLETPRSRAAMLAWHALRKLV